MSMLCRTYRTIRSGACIGHTELPRLCMFDGKIFICKLFAVDAFPTSTVMIGKVSTLDHKVLNNSMEGAPLVMERFAQLAVTLFTRAQTSEVLGRPRGNILIQLHNDPAKGFISMFQVKVYVRIVALGVRDEGSLLVLVDVDFAKQPTKGSLLWCECACSCACY